MRPGAIVRLNAPPASRSPPGDHRRGMRHVPVRQRHEQQIAVDRQRQAASRQHAAQPEQPRRGRHDRNRAEHDRDLVQRFGILEVRQPCGGVVARVLPLLGSRHQLLLALGGGRFALVPRCRVAIALDELIHPGPLFRRQIGRRGSGQFEFLGRGLQKNLPDILRLIEGVSIRGVDVRVQHLLGCLGAAERRYREQHRDHADIDGGDAAEPVAGRRGVRVRLGVLMDLFGDFMRFHGSPLRPSRCRKSSRSIYRERATGAPLGIRSTAAGGRFNMAALSEARGRVRPPRRCLNRCERAQ